jgi:ABC-type bacteriocin/lantibiotic exporter with double-glycine peptidase domain
MLLLIKLITIKRWDFYAIFFTAFFVSLFLFCQGQIIEARGKHVFMKGSYETLIIVMIIFALKYYFGYMKAVNGERESYLGAEILISGITSGFFVNKVIRCVKLLRSLNEAKR